jgi:hypothetical protein
MADNITEQVKPEVIQKAIDEINLPGKPVLTPREEADLEIQDVVEKQPIAKAKKILEEKIKKGEI